MILERSHRLQISLIASLGKLNFHRFIETFNQCITKASVVNVVYKDSNCIISNDFDPPQTAVFFLQTHPKDPQKFLNRSGFLFLIRCRWQRPTLDAAFWNFFSLRRNKKLFVWMQFRWLKFLSRWCEKFQAVVRWWCQCHSHNTKKFPSKCHPISVVRWKLETGNLLRKWIFPIDESLMLNPIGLKSTCRHWMRSCRHA